MQATSREQQAQDCLQKVHVFKSMELDVPRGSERVVLCVHEADVYEKKWVIEKDVWIFLMTENKALCQVFGKARIWRTWRIHQPHSHPWKGHGAHSLGVCKTRVLPTNIFMILLSANWTQIFDSHLLILAEVLFCFLSCVLLMMSLKLFFRVGFPVSFQKS